MGFVQKVVFFLGVTMLGHAAYSAGQCESDGGITPVPRCKFLFNPHHCVYADRSFIRLAEEEYTNLPTDVSQRRKP
jgi:hypothetical protein